MSAVTFAYTCIKEQDRDALRFHWLTDKNLNKKLGFALHKTNIW